jgi:hypothetical protein
MLKSAIDADARPGIESVRTPEAADENGRGWQGESEDDAAGLTSETTRRPEGQAASVARVDFPIKISDVRQPFDGKAVLVLLTFDVSFHEMFRQPIADAPCLGTVCEGAVDGQCAIDG